MRVISEPLCLILSIVTEDDWLKGREDLPRSSPPHFAPHFAPQFAQQFAPQFTPQFAPQFASQYTDNFPAFAPQFAPYAASVFPWRSIRRRASGASGRGEGRTGAWDGRRTSHSSHWEYNPTMDRA